MKTKTVSYKIEIDSDPMIVEVTNKKFSGKDFPMSMRARKRFLFIKAENEDMAIAKARDFLTTFKLR